MLCAAKRDNGSPTGRAVAGLGASLLQQRVLVRQLLQCPTSSRSRWGATVLGGFRGSIGGKTRWTIGHEVASKLAV